MTVPSSSLPAPGGRILLADDDATFREMTQLVLARDGFACDVAASGYEVRDLLSHREYDLLISDIDMPGNRDLGLVAALPQMQAGLPVILVTGAPSVESAVQSVGLSVVAYLIKPLETRAFLFAVRQAVDRYRCYRAVARSRERLAQAASDARVIEAGLRSPGGGAMNPALQAFLDLTLQNMHQSLLDLRSVLAAVRSSDGDDGAAEQLEESRPAALMQALWETVAVLEKTKHSFKSKELGHLRKKLETLVGSRPEPPAEG